MNRYMCVWVAILRQQVYVWNPAYCFQWQNSLRIQITQNFILLLINTFTGILAEILKTTRRNWHSNSIWNFKNLCFTLKIGLCSQLHKSVVIFNSRLLSNYCSVAAKNFMCTFVWTLLMNMFSQEAQLWVQMCTSCPDNSFLILDLQFSPSKRTHSKQTKNN